MQRIWRFVYLAGAVYCGVAGYGSLTPDRTADMNLGWSFVTCGFLFACLLPVGIMALMKRSGVEIFHRPSLYRKPFGWGSELQSLRVLVVGSALTLAGAGIALPKANHGGVMMFWSLAAMALGLFLGERLVYRIYAKRIA